MPLSTIDIDEFTRIAGFDLSDPQTAELREMLHLHPETQKWRWPTWTQPVQTVDLVAVRALIGLLVLDENVLWIAPERPTLRQAFQLLAHSVNVLGTQAEAPSLFDLGDGVTIKIRRANGEEQLERLDTAKRIKFACTRYAGSARGHSADLLIVSGALTQQQLNELLPTMAARRNPQIVYV